LLCAEKPARTIYLSIDLPRSLSMHRTTIVSHCWYIRRDCVSHSRCDDAARKRHYLLVRKGSIGTIWGFGARTGRVPLVRPIKIKIAVKTSLTITDLSLYLQRILQSRARGDCDSVEIFNDKNKSLVILILIYYLIFLDYFVPEHGCINNAHSYLLWNFNNSKREINTFFYKCKKF